MKITDLQTKGYGLIAQVYKTHRTGHTPLYKTFINNLIPWVNDDRINGMMIFIDGKNNVTGGQVTFYDYENGIRCLLFDKDGVLQEQ